MGKKKNKSENKASINNVVQYKRPQFNRLYEKGKLFYSILESGKAKVWSNYQFVKSIYNTNVSGGYENYRKSINNGLFGIIKNQENKKSEDELFKQAAIIEPDIFVKQIIRDDFSDIFYKSTDYTCITRLKNINPGKLNQISLGDIKIDDRIKAITIHNNSKVTVKNIDFCVNNRRFDTIKSIIKDALAEDNLSDKEKIYYLYRYLNKRIFPGLASSYMLSFDYSNVLATLRYYRCEQCVWNAYVFAVLAHKAGVKSRVFAKAGVHSFPEFYFDNKWQMFDSDAGCYVPDFEQKGKIAGFEDILSDPEKYMHPVCYNKHPDQMKETFINGCKSIDGWLLWGEGDTLSKDSDSFNVAKYPFMDLYPGKTINIFYETPWYWKVMYQPGSYYEGYTCFTEINQTKSILAEMKPKLDGVDLISNESKEFLKTVSDNVIIKLDFERGYPIVDGILRLEETNNSFYYNPTQLKFGYEGDANLILTPVIVKKHQIIYRLRRIFFNNETVMNYSLELELCQTGLELELTLELVGTISSSFLPEFHSGKNDLTILGNTEDGSADGCTIDLSVYKEDGFYQNIEELSLTPIFPANGQTLKVDELVKIEWKAFDFKRKVRFELIVSREKDMISCIAPNFDRIVESNLVTVKESEKIFFPKGSYYWKVRFIPNVGIEYGKWSEIFSFNIV